MILSCEQLEQLIAQAQTDAPNETCGIIGGKNGRALRVYPMQNNEPDSRVRYNCDPQQLLQALRDIDDQGGELLAIYHSHPATAAYPSPTDVARAFYPESIYLIISLMNSEQAILRGFQIVAGQIFEITVEVEDKDESPRANSSRTARRTRRSRARGAVATLSKRRLGSGNTRRSRRRVSKKV